MCEERERLQAYVGSVIHLLFIFSTFPFFFLSLLSSSSRFLASSPFLSHLPTFLPSCLILISSPLLFPSSSLRLPLLSFFSKSPFLLLFASQGRNGLKSLLSRYVLFVRELSSFVLDEHWGLSWERHLLFLSSFLSLVLFQHSLIFPVFLVSLFSLSQLSLSFFCFSQRPSHSDSSSFSFFFSFFLCLSLSFSSSRRESEEASLLSCAPRAFLSWDFSWKQESRKNEERKREKELSLLSPFICHSRRGMHASLLLEVFSTNRRRRTVSSLLHNRSQTHITSLFTCFSLPLLSFSVSFLLFFPSILLSRLSLLSGWRQCHRVFAFRLPLFFFFFLLLPSFSSPAFFSPQRRTFETTGL